MTVGRRLAHLEHKNDQNTPLIIYSYLSHCMAIRRLVYKHTLYVIRTKLYSIHLLKTGGNELAQSKTAINVFTSSLMKHYRTLMCDREFRTNHLDQTGELFDLLLVCICYCY